MGVHRKISLLLIFIMIACIFIDAFPNHASGQVQPIDAVEGKLQEISEVEKAILKDLFTLSQGINELENKEIDINQQIATLHADMDDTANRLVENQKSHDLQLDTLKKILVNYQKRGPATYLESFLSAGDLTTFLKSLNLLKDISKNSNALLDSLQKSKQQLEAEKKELFEKEALVKNTMVELQTAKADMLRLKDEQEKILASLADQRQSYETELAYIENMWEEIKGLFANIIVYFNQIIQRGNLPLDKLELTIQFPGIRGILTEQVLNEVLHGQPDLPEMSFFFHPDVINVEIPDKRLSLECHFIIEDNSSITFIIDEGTFYDMPLTQSSIAELLQNGQLKLDFKEVFGVISVKSAQTYEGYMDFMITPLLDPP